MRALRQIAMGGVGARWKLANGRCIGWALLMSLAAHVLFFVGAARGQVDYEEAPIKYSTSPVDDPVARLQANIDMGRATLRFEPEHGYLESVLSALGIPVSSQTLVFSKTSFQRRLINPRTPRALYFSDDVYIGYVQQGEVLEVASIDKTQGTVFYVLPQNERAKPRFLRQTQECLQCHDSTSFTGGIPGLMLRSLYAGLDGQPILTAGTFVTTQQSPIFERWGGWYVTGTHGRQRHLGNLILSDADGAEKPNLSAGANLASLKGRVDVSPYLSPHSDIVALMVLEHQVQMHNLLTRANYQTRIAMAYEQEMNRALERPGDYRSEGMQSRIKSVCEPVVKYMLFSGEVVLTDPISGTSAFAEDFSRQGPGDGKGRNLRQLDLKSRLFKYPCSYLIYSEQFDALPDPAREYIYARLVEILSGRDQSPAFQHLSQEDRRDILQILRETKKEFANNLKD